MSMKQHIAEHQQAVSDLVESVPVLEAMAETIVDCYEKGGCVYIMGNGGSAADAQHISAELLGRFRVNRRALPAVALTTDTSTITAVSNDYGADVIFSRQVEGLVKANDVVWLLSTSGRSPNIIAAAKVARKQNAKIIGFTGENRHELAEYCDHCLFAKHDKSDRIQEVHALAYHMICGKIEETIVLKDKSV